MMMMMTARLQPATFLEERISRKYHSRYTGEVRPRS